MNTLSCSTCREEKTETEFYVDRSKEKRSHRSHICIPCAAAHKRELRKNPAWVDNARAVSKLWRQNNRERARNGVRNATLKAKYGIGLEEYNKILASQNGGCAICGSTTPRINHPKKKHSALHVDHCHKTDKIRGLLCMPCNTVLGQMYDSPELLRKAADYLEGE